MKTGLLLTLLVLAAGTPEESDRPSRLARWFDGAAKETEAAREAWDVEDFETARQELESALELAPDDPKARFNAGTGRLATQDVDAGLELLKPAVDSGGELAADAAFNLGNGYLEQSDLEAAIQAYESSLRFDPDHGDAKHNLELALQLQQQQEQEEQESENSDESEDDENQEEQEQQKGNEPQDPSEEEKEQNSDPQQDDEGDPDEDSEESQGDQEQEAQEEEDPQSNPEGQPEGQEPPQQPSRLPSFEDQEDMTAEQAAALLEAVENLEQEQRVQMAEDERAERALNLNVEKDW